MVDYDTAEMDYEGLMPKELEEIEYSSRLWNELERKFSEIINRLIVEYQFGFYEFLRLDMALRKYIKEQKKIAFGKKKGDLFNRLDIAIKREQGGKNGNA